MSKNGSDGQDCPPLQNDRSSVHEGLTHTRVRTVVGPPASIPGDEVMTPEGNGNRALLAATDLSSRSDPVLQRAILLSAHFGARLTLLNVVGDGGTAGHIVRAKRRAARLLKDEAARLAAMATVQPDILVKAGRPVSVIAETAKAEKADLVIMGRRARALRGLIRATTAEQVIRTAQLPVLIVGKEAATTYRRVLLALDVSDTSARAVRIARSLRLLDAAEMAILHVFTPRARFLLDCAGADRDVITKHVVNTALGAADQLIPFLRREGLDAPENQVLLEDGDPFGAIMAAIDRRRPDLLVIGTRAHTGLKRLLLGSTADLIIRHGDCDLLVVPPRRADIGVPVSGATPFCADLGVSGSRAGKPLQEPLEDPI